ncbi:hypothetical protein [Aliarcobacter butzleri]|uniref:hypothetical protein n=1 Tax=Aliarcobacter butzleri TaxID=28197 RepID=UPI003B22535B
MTTYQGIYIVNDKNKIYMQIEEYNNHYKVQTSNELNFTNDNYILDEKYNLKVFSEGKEAFHYVVTKFFNKPIERLETTGFYFVSENDLREVSKVRTITERSI